MRTRLRYRLCVCAAAATIAVLCSASLVAHWHWRSTRALLDVVTLPLSVEPCTDLARFGGDGDGGKLLCGVHNLPPGCVVYSLGSRNDFSFEAAVLAATPCKVATFDCTVDGAERPRDARLSFHRQCLGDEPGQFSIAQLAEANGDAHIDILKMDIEGGEHSVFASLRAHAAAAAAAAERGGRGRGGEDSLLPDQIVFELHAWDASETARVAALWSSVFALGYRIAAREDNPTHPGCAEFTVVRVLAPFDYRHGGRSR